MGQEKAREQGREAVFADPTVCRIAEFLASIGLGVRTGSIPEATVVPGIHINGGDLVVDESRLTYPGDLLHEAGHVAVCTKDQRQDLNGSVGGDGGDEMAAIAWSYAAAVHLGIDPTIVFHPAGYQGGSESILSSFSAPGSGIGVPMLQWFGLTLDMRKGAELGLPSFPSMLRWTR